MVIFLKLHSIITLLTDFGTKDFYVGVMKGVIYDINPSVLISDISHDIPTFGIKFAAFSLFTYWKYYPPDTIHLVVVDPGVGSERGAIVSKIDNHYFVLPDNGIISYIWKEGTNKQIYRIENEKFFHKPVSSTFHGRDIFAPVSAYLSKNVNITEFGEKIDNPILFDLPMPIIYKNYIDQTDGSLWLKVTTKPENNASVNINKRYWQVEKSADFKLPSLKIKLKHNDD